MSENVIDSRQSLFDNKLKAKGLGLNKILRKKKALIDFILTLNEMLEKCLTERNIRKGFIESGLTDNETGMWCNYENLMKTCKRWPSATKKTGLQLAVKTHVRSQFQVLGRKQLDNGCVTYEEMRDLDFPLGK